MPWQTSHPRADLMFLTVWAELWKSVLLEVMLQGRNGSTHPVPPIKAQGVLLLGWYPPVPFTSLGVLTCLTVSLATDAALPEHPNTIASRDASANDKC